MAKQSSQPKKMDGRKAARPGKQRAADKPAPPAPTLDSVVALFQENPSSEKGQFLSLVSIRVQLGSMVRDAKFIDQPSLQAFEVETQLPARELTKALNELVKIGKSLHKILPGLFLSGATNAHESKQIVVARLVLTRYLAALEGTGGVHGIMRAQSQVDTLLKGKESLLIPTLPTSEAKGPSLGDMPAQWIHLGETPLLDLLLPQWRRIGDPNWVSPLCRYRGNWIEQAFMPVFEYLSKQILMLFLLRGWPVEALAQKRSQARTIYYEVFGQILVLSEKPRIASRSISSHLDHACQWAETEEAQQEMSLLLEMDRAHARDAQVLARAKKHDRQL